MSADRFWRLFAKAENYVLSPQEPTTHLILIVPMKIWSPGAGFREKYKYSLGQVEWLTFSFFYFLNRSKLVSQMPPVWEAIFRWNLLTLHKRKQIQTKEARSLLSKGEVMNKLGMRKKDGSRGIQMRTLQGYENR